MALRILVIVRQFCLTMTLSWSMIAVNRFSLA